MRNVQIPYDLFMDLVLYHLNGEEDFDRRGVPESCRRTTSSWEREQKRATLLLSANKAERHPQMPHAPSESPRQLCSRSAESVIVGYTL